MRRCALCGIPISRQLHEPWLKEFRAGEFAIASNYPGRANLCLVWAEDHNWDDVKLSGVGICGEHDNVSDSTVPIDPSKRYDDNLDQDALMDITLVGSNIVEIVYPVTDRYGRGPFRGWEFHASCWDLFNVGFTPNLRLLYAACLSMPVGRDNLMNWGHKYGGAATIAWDYNNLPVLGSQFSDYTSITQDFRSDPFHVPALAKAIERSTHLQNDTFLSRLSPNGLNLNGDEFRRLSPELLQIIVILLPTHDVHSLRLASPAFALLSLSERFWASRFREGNEFEYIFEPLHSPPESWRTLYLSLQNWACDNPSMANRKRVWALAKRLQNALCQLEGVPCDGIASWEWFESLRASEDPRQTPWLTAAQNIDDMKTTFSRGCRVLRARILHFSPPLEAQSMSVSFVHTTGGRFVSGLSFVDNGSKSHALGYIHRDSVLIQIPTAQRIQGWELAFDTSGIKAIAVVTEDGSKSPWAGEPGNFPRWYLAEAEGISAIKAEFDVSKSFFSHLLHIGTDNLS